MTSYTDEQVLDQATWLVGARLRDKTVFSMPIDMGLSTSEKMLRSLLADRTLLQAEVNVLRPNAERYLWLRDECDTTNGFLIAQRIETDEWDEAIDCARSKKGDV